MRSTAQKLQRQVELTFPDVEKLHLVDSLLAELDKPDPTIDAVWAAEMKIQGAPKEFIRAVSLLKDASLAKRVLEFLKNERP